MEDKPIAMLGFPANVLMRTASAFPLLSRMRSCKVSGVDNMSLRFQSPGQPETERARRNCNSALQAMRSQPGLTFRNRNAVRSKSSPHAVVIYPPCHSHTRAPAIGLTARSVRCRRYCRIRRWGTSGFEQVPVQVNARARHSHFREIALDVRPRKANQHLFLLSDSQENAGYCQALHVISF